MNKKILILSIILLFLFPNSSFAVVKNSKLKNTMATVPTLAILDTAIDNSIPEIKDKLIYEVCILQLNSCPNGSNFMEGKNSATLPLKALLKNNFSHGTSMASAAIKSNPNMNIIFIRVIGQNVDYSRQAPSEATIWMGLDWVIQNKDIFNIQAVSMSQGSHALIEETEYCPRSLIVENKIDTLVGYGIPVFFPSGNSFDYKRIDWPACIPSTISVGGATKSGIESYSNYDSSLLDFNATSQLKVALPGKSYINASGTSISTQVAAASWLAIKYVNPTLTYTEVYNILKDTSKPVKGKQGSSTMIDLPSALNG